MTRRRPHLKHAGADADRGAVGSLAGMEGIRTIVRDGRAGREGGEAGVGDGRGAILETREGGPPLQEGANLQLEDGTEVQVIGVNHEITGEGWEQVVVVGNVPWMPRQSCRARGSRPHGRPLPG